MKKAKKAGIDFMILRVGYTGTSSKKPSTDSTFKDNYNACVANDIPIGIYYYSIATTTAKAKEEAEWVVKKLKGLDIDYPVYIDVEDKLQRGKGKTTLANVCNTFCKIIVDAGYVAGVYASYDWLNNQIGTIDSQYTIWVAQYASKCGYSKPYDIWQYSSSGKVTGLPASNYHTSKKVVDVNYCYKRW